MSSLRFIKLHGLGNDFIVVSGLDAALPAWIEETEHVQRICARHSGVGADGILLVLPPTDPAAHARMVVWNADGSRPEMCGNGIRCVAKLLHDHVPALRSANPLAVETDSGTRECTLAIDRDGSVAMVRVDMGQPQLDRASLPMHGQGRFIDGTLDLPLGEKITGTAVSMGNPHLVAFFDDARQLEAAARRLGPLIENHDAFPQRTNAEFARLEDGHAELWVWERGCGITQACGTGACATAVAAVASGRHAVGAPLSVALPGGNLVVEVAPELARVWMTGPATEVYEGSLRW